MKFSVKKSFVRANPSFEARVAAHAKEMRDWLDREEKVASQAPNVPEAERWVSCPRPVAPNHLVESAVNEKGVADYEVDNDDPTPEQIIELRKAVLLERLRAAEAEAHNAACPMLKRPLLALQAADVRAQESAVRAEVVAENGKIITAAVAEHNDAAKKAVDGTTTLLKLAAKAGLAKLPEMPVFSEPDLIDVEAETRRRLPPEAIAMIDDAVAVGKKDAAISRAAAQVQSEIHDLTVDTIDTYQIPDLTRG